MDIALLQHIWFIIIGLLFAVYSVLDGFDLGIGALMPVLAKDEKETGQLFEAIGPLWDGNEVWLLVAGGSLFAAFPQVYATVFSGFYLPVMAIIFALIFRAVSFEFYALDKENRKIWRNAFMVGSLLPSLLFGIALGNVILGIPMDYDWNFSGNILLVFRPFALVVGILGLVAIIMQGSTFTLIKTSGPVYKRARFIAEKFWILYCSLVGLALVATIFYRSHFLAKPVPWIFTSLVVGSLFAIKYFLKKNNDVAVFLSSSVAFMSLWGIAGSVLYPNLVPATKESGFNLTLNNASSSALTLQVMLIIALIGMPLVIIYSVYTYKLFKGKVS